MFLSATAQPSGTECRKQGRKVVDLHYICKMKTDRKALGLAIRNAGILSALLLIVLCAFEHDINLKSIGIHIGYAIICFVVELPLFYVAILKHWLSDSLSVKYLYLPTLSFIILLLLSMLYTSIIYGYPPRDYFINPDGSMNVEQLLHHIQMALIGVAFVFANQMLGAATEREIIVNSNRLSEEHCATFNISGITFKVEDFLYAESEANYLKIVCKNEERRVRMTMKQLLAESKAFPELTQCHRAYLVNLINVSYYEGSSRKGEIHFHRRSDTVPVSRNFAKIITDLLTSAQ